MRLCDKEASWCPRLHEEEWCQQVEGSDPYSALERPHLEFHARYRPLSTKEIWSSWRVRQRATKMRKLEHLSCEKGLRELGTEGRVPRGWSWALFSGVQ